MSADTDKRSSPKRSSPQGAGSGWAKLKAPKTQDRDSSPRAELTRRLSAAGLDPLSPENAGRRRSSVGTNENALAALEQAVSAVKKLADCGNGKEILDMLEEVKDKFKALQALIANKPLLDKLSYDDIDKIHNDLKTFDSDLAEQISKVMSSSRRSSITLPAVKGDRNAAVAGIRMVMFSITQNVDRLNKIYSDTNINSADADTLEKMMDKDILEKTVKAIRQVLFFMREKRDLFQDEMQSDAAKKAAAAE